MSEPTAEELRRLEELVPLAELGWAAKAGGTTPLLAMPKERFAWAFTGVYFANSGIAPSGELYLEVRAFDGKARQGADPSEIDWCIPMAYEGAPELERLGWKVGWGEGWSDSSPALRLRFDARWRPFFAEVRRARKLAIAERGQATASLLVQLERNLRDVARFVGTGDA